MHTHGEALEGPPRRLLGGLGALADRLAAPLTASHYLELVNPLWARHRLRARVEAVWDETPDTRTLTLRPGRGWRPHRAGQHVRVEATIDGAQHARTYSIASAPERLEADGCIEITVRLVEGGRVSRHLVRELRPGDHLGLALPAGDFTLPEDSAPPPLLLVTGGSGITPVMSMLRSLDARGAHADVVHLHYAPRHQAAIFARELEELARRHPWYRLRLELTREPGRPRRGFTAARLAEVCADWREREAYVCGPESLIEVLEAHWRTAGRDAHLHRERFRAPRAAVPADAAGGRVRFARSGTAIDADAGTSLLEAAERAGLRPAHGCRMGICHSCTATLRAGCARDLRSNATIAEPGARVQICVAAAAGDVEIDL